MAQDSISKKAKKPPGPPVPSQTIADPSHSDADAMLVESPSGVSAPTEQFAMRAAENTAEFTMKPGANTEQFAMKPNENTEQFTMKPGDADEPEALVNEQTAAEVNLGSDTHAPDRNLGQTKPMSAGQVEAVKKKAARTMGPDASVNLDGPDGPKATLLGDFKLLKKLGQGGMGSVYKAHQVKLDREVALKILNKELSGKDAFVKRFQREAKVMAKLDHPNILRCFDVGEAQGYHFLAMEYVEGGSIEGYLKKYQKFNLGDALHIILACAAALEHAHELGMIHRDIKPDNILLTKKGVVKVADLGLAKATDDDMSLTKTGTGAGTPIFMAPEQARDAKHVDGKVDTYALGCMLYVFLTGETPFKGETLVELIESKEKGKFAPMRKFDKEIPERLDLIVDKMLSKDPKHRYTSAEIIAEIEGLGLHHDHLSFLGDAAASQAKTISTRGPAKVAAKTQAPAANATQAPASKTPQAVPGEELYFWQFKNDEGKLLTKKMKKEQLITLIKTGSVDAQSQISRTSKAGYRALGTYVEFASLFRGAATKAEADKKGDKFRNAYKQLVQQDVSRKRWRWIHNLYLWAGGLFGFGLWLIILGAAGVGGFFLVKFLIGFVGEKVAKSGQL